MISKAISREIIYRASRSKIVSDSGKETRRIRVPSFSEILYLRRAIWSARSYFSLRASSMNEIAASGNESHGSPRRIGETDLNTEEERERRQIVSGRLGPESSGPDPRAFCSNSLHQISRDDERWYCFQIGFRFEDTIATTIHASLPLSLPSPPCLFDLVSRY